MRIAVRCAVRRFSTTGSLCTEAAGPSGGVREFLKIGDVRIAVRSSRRPELVPAGYARLDASAEVTAHLKWMLQKDLLKQDVFLIGPPGRLRSQIVLQYLELTNSEYEWLSITRDSTEADIKQRREIRGGTAFYSDLAAVRAAIEGRVLVIDGVEKAERNVLPILNNLLENREMQLDDGRFLMHHNKFDRLNEKYSTAELRGMGLERVSPSFRVVALGLPVPKFPGYPLDPPLRSRFQSRNVPDLAFESIRAECLAAAPAVPSDKINDLVALVYAIDGQSDLPFPYVPISNLPSAVAIWNRIPSLPTESAFRLLYPMEALLSDTETKRIGEFLKKFGVQRGEVSASLVSASRGKMVVETQGKTSEIAVPSGPLPPSPLPSFVSTPAHSRLLVQLTAALSTGDVALLGPKGAGKSTVVSAVASLLGQRPKSLVLYQDMNSRELLQSRRMNEAGETLWEDSALVRAAREGAVCVLDGIDRLHPSALSALAPLLHHRRVDLPDGSRLVGHAEWKRIIEKTGLSPEEIVRRGVSEVAESFRVVLVGDSSSKGTRWMNSSMASLTSFVEMPPLSVEEKSSVIRSIVPTASVETVDTVVRFAEKLATSHDQALLGVAPSLSLRRLIQMAKRDTLQPGTVRSLLERATLARFFPALTKRSFEGALDEAGIRDEHAPEYELESAMAAVRNSSLNGAEEEAMIPETLFYDNAQHNSVLVDMARDFRLGEHLLLIGNQGVGKNKITDRFLQLINRPRQYMQLHRDTTVESLTLQTKVEGGVVRSEDSALVRAARSGHVLVIDEADKASVHIIAVLKSLLDTGTLQLGDGRRVVPASLADPSDPHAVPLHPTFRCILLANRPGFPFLGNDLFGTIGDLCAVHVVDNPARDSELQMLKQYAPGVPPETLDKLVSAFDELRRMADEGLLQYPYSTREIVSVAKHLNEFPSDPVPEVVRNVFDFDGYSTERLETVEEVFRKHGIPLGVERPMVRVAEIVPIPAPVPVGQWHLAPHGGQPIVPSSSTITLDWIDPIAPIRDTLIHGSSRSELFTEEVKHWQLPLTETQLCSDVVSLGGGAFVVAAVNPTALFYVDDASAQHVWRFDLYTHGIKGARGYEPVLRMARVGENRVLIHEEKKNDLLLFDRNEMAIARVQKRTRNIMDTVAKLTQPFFAGSERWRIIPGDRMAMYQVGGRGVDLLDEGGATCTHLLLPRDIRAMASISANRFLVHWKDSSYFSLLSTERHGWAVTPVEHSLGEEAAKLRSAFRSISGQHTSFDVSDAFYGRSIDFPLNEKSSSLVVSRRPPVDPSTMIDGRRPYYASPSALDLIDPYRNVVAVGDDTLVRVAPRWATPSHVLGKDTSAFGIAGFLEAVQMSTGHVSYIPVPEARRQSFAVQWATSFSPVPFVLSPGDGDKDHVLTVDIGGGVRSWEADRGALASSFGRWKSMVQGKGSEADRIEFEKTDFDLSKIDSPKIGKFDPQNTPHVGGNTWAGGTGGYNTAGLGGVGGPFRLDAGHDVHQMPEFAKAQVPAHILAKAKEIAKAEYAKRLKEIKMSTHDAEAYDSLWKRVEKNVGHVRETIDGLEAARQERVWVRHQTTGDLDDGKLIEGVAGENNIYRRRADKDPDPGTPQTRPKRLRVAMDLSGSMYRFNGYDKRLQRSLETALLVMTALEGKQDKVKYELTGHSGDGPYTPFVIKDNYPKNDKERLDVLRQMLAHTQFCSSGDYTLEALTDARKSLAMDDNYDERIVLLISDANLDRYGIRPRDLARIMDQDDGVKAYVILIGSLGEQAGVLQRALPPGRAFVCTDTDQMPRIIQQIFDANLL